MTVWYYCELCNGENEASEFDVINGKHICRNCQEKAMNIGISIMEKVAIKVDEQIMEYLR
jgi:hypothetical protein